MSKLIIANWKSNKNIQEARTWVNDYVKRQTSNANSQATVVVCPAFPLLTTVVEEIRRSKAQLDVGVQTISPYSAGSYTGSVSVRNVEGLLVKYVILGHSERRRYFHETHTDVAKQVDQALSVGIIPIICVDKEYVVSQAAAIADEVKKQCIVAYEPADNIGTGVAEDVGTVQTIIAQIKDSFGEVSVLYGGSVDQTNIHSYLTISDGVIIGSASLDPHTFAQMIATV